MRPQRTIRARQVLDLLVNPMDSFRYFEFDFAWRAVSELPRLVDYLDVSSPRLFPLVVLRYRAGMTAHLLNPDGEDLALTRSLASDMGLGAGACFHGDVIESSDLVEESVDVITCISVLEHIRDDVDALSAMWRLLRPGGQLILTVPCAAAATEEYLDVDPYGLSGTESDGCYFGQRFYDADLLHRQIYSVVGHPAKSAVYGEKIAGSFAANRHEKLANGDYPYWRESFMMAKDYRYFDSVSELPGCGVIAMKFVRPR